MRPALIVIDAPSLDLGPGVVDRHELCSSLNFDFFMVLVPPPDRGKPLSSSSFACRRFQGRRQCPWPDGVINAVVAASEGDTSAPNAAMMANELFDA
jgi:hypothetical protein